MIGLILGIGAGICFTIVVVGYVFFYVVDKEVSGKL
jgi:hypothetical protein